MRILIIAILIFLGSTSIARTDDLYEDIDRQCVAILAAQSNAKWAQTPIERLAAQQKIETLTNNLLWMLLDFTNNEPVPDSDVVLPVLRSRQDFCRHNLGRELPLGALPIAVAKTLTSYHGVLVAGGPQSAFAHLVVRYERVMTGF